MNTGPSFKTMLEWWLTDNWGPLTEWVIRYHAESGRKLTQQECLDYVAALITDFEITAEKFAQEENMSLSDLYKTMKQELETLNKGQAND